MRREGFADRLIPGGAQSAELDALVILIKAQLALAVFEERLVAIGAHGAHVERELEIARRRGPARRERADRQHAARADRTESVLCQ